MATKTRRLTKKQKDFVKEYIETGNGTQAALKAYNTDKPNTAKAIASENLTKPNVRAYLESKAERASEIVFDIAENGENDGVRLNASKDILDRAGYKPVEKLQSIVLNVDLTERTYIESITEKVISQMREDEFERNA